MRRPCEAAPAVFTVDVDDLAVPSLEAHVASVAGAACSRCPIASECLLDALRVEAAYRRGDDPWGVSGVCGGVRFTPGAMPYRVAA